MNGQQQQQGISSTKQKRKKRILIVDDEADIAFVFKLALEYDGGFEVDTFYQPEIALTSFERGVYDMVLLDINMPILNGFQLYAELRKIDEMVKICFITASINVHFHGLSIERSQSPECFIRKPIEREEFVRRIKAQLNDLSE